MTNPQIQEPEQDTHLHSMNSIEDVMERLKVGRNTAFNLISSGELRSVKIGRRRLVSEKALRDYIAAIDQ
jgi:excisionase family DNA binding protein